MIQAGQGGVGVCGVGWDRWICPYPPLQALRWNLYALLERME